MVSFLDVICLIGSKYKLVVVISWVKYFLNFVFVKDVDYNVCRRDFVFVFNKRYIYDFVNNFVC